MSALKNELKFLECNEIDKKTAIGLKSIQDSAKAGRISCNTLNSKFKRVNKCNGK